MAARKFFAFSVLNRPNLICFRSRYDISKFRKFLNSSSKSIHSFLFSDPNLGDPGPGIQGTFGDGSHRVRGLVEEAMPNMGVSTLIAHARNEQNMFVH